jgi:hypothetical protein
MRWIFFVLVIANISLFGWHFFQVPDDDVADHSAQVPKLDRAPRIRLLSELGKSDGTGATDKPAAPEFDPPRQPLCTFVGPFEATEQAAQLVERLAAMEIEGDVAEVEIPSGPGYWVYLAPRASRREALRSLTELQARGVDSFIIPKGELMNGISLGMFSQEDLARAHVRDMAELGLNAEIDIIERSYKEIWVSVPKASADSLGEQAWQRLLESNKKADRRQNFCLHVASRGNFH